MGGGFGFHHIMQGGLGDGLASERAFAGQSFGEFAANHASRAEDENMHKIRLLERF
jgi:hypothetical protein